MTAAEEKTGLSKRLFSKELMGINKSEVRESDCDDSNINENERKIITGQNGVGIKTKITGHDSTRIVNNVFTE